MRGNDTKPVAMFSYVSAEERVPQDHPLRQVRAFVDDILRDMSREFDALYARHGRPSIPPERLLRAQLLPLFYSIRSERLLMEQLDYNILFRWFVGLEMDEPIWVPTVFSKNRDRLLQHAVAHSFCYSNYGTRLRRAAASGRPHGSSDDSHTSAAGSVGVCVWIVSRSMWREAPPCAAACTSCVPRTSCSKNLRPERSTNRHGRARRTSSWSS